jgi:hypothetical protein
MIFMLAFLGGKDLVNMARITKEAARREV